MSIWEIINISKSFISLMTSLSLYPGVGTQALIMSKYRRIHPPSSMVKIYAIYVCILFWFYPDYDIQCMYICTLWE